MALDGGIVQSGQVGNADGNRARVTIEDGLVLVLLQLVDSLVSQDDYLVGCDDCMHTDFTLKRCGNS